MYLNIHVVRVIHPRGLKVTHTTFKLDVTWSIFVFPACFLLFRALCALEDFI